MNYVDQIIETWNINNRVNLMLIDAIPPEALHASLSPRGGGSPARQFAHIYNIRFWKLEKMAGDLVNGWNSISLKEDLNKPLLNKSLEESAECISTLLRRSVEKDKPKGFKRGVVPLLGYFISHESHHRGNIILTLKQSGHKLPKSVTYGIWDWDKI